MAEPNDGWPRHLPWAYVSLGRVPMADGINGNLDKTTDWKRVGSDRLAPRIRY